MRGRFEGVKRGLVKVCFSHLVKRKRKQQRIFVKLDKLDHQAAVGLVDIII